MSDNGKQQGPDNGGGNPWMKSLLIWVGILAALALFVTVFDTRTAQPTGNTIPYSTFLDKVESGDVKDVNIAVGTGVVTGTMTEGKFRTYTPNDPQLTQRLRDKGVVINARPEEQPSVWYYLLVQSLPFLLFLGIAFFVLRQMQKNSGSGAMGFGKSRPAC
jgi:cell division protease FtsH